MSPICRLFASGVLILSVAQCSRQTDLLYHLSDVKPVRFDMNTKVKEVVGNNRLDILWVIDNSGSMMTHQQNVIDNTEKFMKAFTKRAHLDWKIGLLSSHQGDKPFVGFAPGDELDKNTPNPVDKFQRAVARLGFNQGCPELVFAPLIDAFKTYPTWFRNNAYLVVITLTDTQEDVKGIESTFENELRKVKPRFDDFRFYGTYSGGDFKCPSFEPEWHYKGSPFEYFIDKTHGEVFELCGKDFGDNLAKISEEISKLVERAKVFLSERPNVNTLTVSFKDHQLPGGLESEGGMWLYDFDKNAIVFHNLDFAVGDQNAEIQISFEKAQN